MSKPKDPLLIALENGRSFSWRVPEGGDLASMRKAIKHGQTLTMAPVVDAGEIQVGDLVFVRWHQGHLFHMVGEIEGDQYLIVNSLGKANGWVSADAILGRVVKIVDPEPRPSLPDMLEQLEKVYQTLIEQKKPEEDDARRLLSVIQDLQWYADRIGAERWDQLPRQNLWSYEQLLWQLTRQARADMSKPLVFFIDRGKQCVGQAAELLALFEPGEMA